MKVSKNLAPLALQLFLSVLVLAAPEVSHAALPWERPIQEIGASLSGPVARYGALIAFVIFGLLVAFGEVKGMVGGVARVMFGLSFALMAGSWVSYFSS